MRFIIFPTSLWQLNKMTLVWGKPRQPPLGSEEVRLFFLKINSLWSLIINPSIWMSVKLLSTNSFEIISFPALLNVFFSAVAFYFSLGHFLASTQMLLFLAFYMNGFYFDSMPMFTFPSYQFKKLLGVCIICCTDADSLFLFRICFFLNWKYYHENFDWSRVGPVI